MKEMECNLCQKKFFRDSKQPFCSRKCSQLNQSKKVKIKCLMCGLVFYAKRYEVEKRGKKFCSRKCYGKKQRIEPNPFTDKKREASIANLGSRMLGKKHKQESKNKIAQAHLGKRKKRRTIIGTNAKLKKALRGSIVYGKWRRFVFERDNFTCCECKQVGGQLHAHHISPFSVLVDNFVKKYKGFLTENILFELLLMEQKLWDINNGTTMCISCHKKTDTYLNNKKDMIELHSN